MVQEWRIWSFLFWWEAKEQADNTATSTLATSLLHFSGFTVQFAARHLFMLLTHSTIYSTAKKESLSGSSPSCVRSIAAFNLICFRWQVLPVCKQYGVAQSAAGMT